MIPMACCQSHMEFLIKSNPIKIIIQTRKFIWFRTAEAVQKYFFFNPVISSSESCMGRCENGFDSQRKCQCDSMCKYYKSCCSDFEATCGMMSKKAPLFSFL